MPVRDFTVACGGEKAYSVGRMRRKVTPEKFFHLDFALLLQIAAPRLRSLGISIRAPATPLPCEHVLYDRLETRLGPAAHSYYNSLIRRIASFARALEHEQTKQPQRTS